ncbi:MAG: hypothetical protein ACOC2Q_01305 [Spirochaetota bacterium]
MNKLNTVLLVLLSVAAGAFAQQAGPVAPEETEIIVPELVLQVEELELQEVSAVLPEQGELALGRISIPLPGADELIVDDVSFALPQPGVAVGRDTSSVFSSGRLGAGTVNHIVGELSLFKLGADPRFRLRFTHEGLDGYQFGEAGNGYFSNLNVIDGWFAGGSERFRSDVEAAFSEDVVGLQGQSDYFSTGLRRTTATATTEFAPEPLISLTGAFDGSFSTRILSASGDSSVPPERELSVSPRIESRFGIGSVDLVFTTSYFLRLLADGEIPTSQEIDVLAGVDVDLPSSFAVSARAGILWDPEAALRYPWSLSLDLLLGEALETSVSAGYRVERLLLGDLWSQVPLAAAGDSEGSAELVNDGQWYGTLGARWSGASGLALTTSAEFVAHDAVVDLEPYDAANDEFPFVQRDMLSLRTSARASWRPGPGIQVEAGWSGVFIDSTTGTPTSSLESSVRVGDASERFSATADVRTDFFPEVSMPWLGLSGSFAPSDELEFTLELADLLAPLLESGRPALGPRVSPEYPFIEPGFRASIFTRISL